MKWKCCTWLLQGLLKDQFKSMGLVTEFFVIDSSSTQLQMALSSYELKPTNS